MNGGNHVFFSTEAGRGLGEGGANTRRTDCAFSRLKRLVHKQWRRLLLRLLLVIFNLFLDGNQWRRAVLQVRFEADITARASLAALAFGALLFFGICSP